MIVIDALQIRSGGGYGVLASLVNGLVVRNLDYTVLLNDSMRKAKIEGKIIEVDANPFKRKQILQEQLDRNNATFLFTFNFPPPFKTNCTVVTDFQNLLLTKNADINAFSWKEKLNVFLKRKYLGYNVNNTDTYVFPTAFVKSGFVETFKISENKCKVLPHYDEKTLLGIKQEAVRQFSKVKNRFIYVSSPSKHKNHTNLIAAWDILLQNNIKPVLALGLPPDDPRSVPLLTSIKELNEKGANIININKNGVLPYNQVLFETYKSTFTIFPSFNETFGFGLVEGAFFDNKILASQKPFVASVVKPSLYFDPYDPQKIADAVIKALRTNIDETTLVFKNRINEIINLMV